VCEGGTITYFVSRPTLYSCPDELREYLQTYSHAQLSSIPQKVVHKLWLFYLNISTKLTNAGNVVAMTGIFTFLRKKPYTTFRFSHTIKWMTAWFKFKLRTRTVQALIFDSSYLPSKLAVSKQHWHVMTCCHARRSSYESFGDPFCRLG